MEWVETTGRTVQEAKDRALDQLGVAEDDAEFDVVEEPRAGLFGRVRGEARVRARVRPTQPRPKAERRDRKKKSDSLTSSTDLTGESTEDSASSPSTAAQVLPTTRKSGSRATGSKRQETQRLSTESSDNAAAQLALAVAMVTGDEDPGIAANDSPSKGSSTRGGRNSRSKSLQQTSQEVPTSRSDAGQTNQETVVDAAQVGEEARRFVQGLVDAFGLSGQASVHRDEDDLEVSVDGADLGLLVGPRGVTLQAVQELTRVAAQRRLGDHETRLRVDVAGYRVRRREALSRFADQVAGEVVSSGTARSLEPMSSSDRKVIHDSLSANESVVTRSEGDDPNRRVVIAPANG